MSESSNLIEDCNLWTYVKVERIQRKRERKVVREVEREMKMNERKS